MATYTDRVRQGLPRVAGGAPWPADGITAGVNADVAGESAVTTGAPAPASVIAPAPAAAPVPEHAAAPAPATTAAQPVAPAQPAAVGPVLRQGLPRVPGGAPWPAGGAAASATLPTTPTPTSTAEAAQTENVPAPATPVVPAAASVEAVTETPASVAPVSAVGDVPLRRGLPRVADGEPWPAAGFAPAGAAPRAHDPVLVHEPAPVLDVAPVQEPVHAPAVAPEPAAAPAPAAASTPLPAAAPAPAPAPAAASAPAPAPIHTPAPAKQSREPIMIGAKSLAQWVKIAVLGGLGAIVAAGIIVLAARGVTTLPGVPGWLERYPGEYELPESSVDGFPAWARWGHFFNLFLMVLIIRSGVLVRTQQKPPAFWTPKKGGKKISINLWLHTSLDVLWVVNGLVFIVLLFVSGHWMRIVPTSWEVFPNAASAMLQYLTLDWPVEDGWVNYNSLQQLMYFLVVFVAAPVAIITGVRMSEWWPQDAAKLNKLYPAPLARAVHFPTMLFFVLFIIVHVFLVFTTGALKNLNHMFVGTPIVSWTGFWLFALAIAITVGGWFACKPLVLAPIASLFGKVSNR